MIVELIGCCSEHGAQADDLNRYAAFVNRFFVFLLPVIYF
jgi:hypothetical protein